MSIVKKILLFRKLSFFIILVYLDICLQLKEKNAISNNMVMHRILHCINICI